MPLMKVLNAKNIATLETGKYYDDMDLHHREVMNF